MGTAGRNIAEELRPNREHKDISLTLAHHFEYIEQKLDRIEKLLALLTDVSVNGFKLVVVKPEEEMKE